MTVLSVIIVTRNRRQQLQQTLQILCRTMPLPKNKWECIVVDNGSSDGTPAMIAEQFPQVHCIAHQQNEGACARTDAIEPASGRYLLFLDDDSYPTGDAVSQMIDWLNRHPECGAVYGNVLLPDGTGEASAYPAAPICCALCARREVMLAIGGFDRRFNRQGEELDLALRMIDAGWTIARLESATFRHDKPAGCRVSPTVRRLDLRNNLYIALRYLPPPLVDDYVSHWRERYAALAGMLDRLDQRERVQQEAEAMVREVGCFAADPRTIEDIFQVAAQSEFVAGWAGLEGIRHVAIAGYSKNLPATWRACVESGLDVVAVIDGGAASVFAGLVFHDVPVMLPSDAQQLEIDGIVLSNINPAQVRRRAATLQQMYAKPVLHFPAAASAVYGQGGRRNGVRSGRQGRTLPTVSL